MDPPRPGIAAAVRRLQGSRERLCQAWLPDGTPAGGRSGAASAWHHGGAAGLWRHWRRRLARVPGIDLLLDAAQRSWQRHPWRHTLQIVSTQLRPHVAPLLQRHPLAAAALAAGAGAALVAWRPWRQPWCRRALQACPGQALRWGQAQLGQLPWLAVLQTLLAASAAAAASPAPPTAASPSSPSSPDAAAG
ncbi:MAG: hypothetical protein U1F56_08335 [Rubrivivax sp.]